MFLTLLVVLRPHETMLDHIRPHDVNSGRPAGTAGLEETIQAPDGSVAPEMLGKFSRKRSFSSLPVQAHWFLSKFATHSEGRYGRRRLINKVSYTHDNINNSAVIEADKTGV